MTRPGDRLRSMAARVCSATTLERLIDPVSSFSMSLNESVVMRYDRTVATGISILGRTSERRMSVNV